VVKPYYRRTPKYYDGTELTARRMSELLPAVLSQIGKVYVQRPDLILAAWPDVIGPKLAPMTQAVSFIDGILVVKVKNSTLHSLLSQNDKPGILNVLRKKFPDVLIKTIYFRIG
jgi:hypothetical protein